MSINSLLINKQRPSAVSP